ncbi:MAG: ribosome biogenesis GTPase Der, partial [Acidobacteriota bacterium]
MSRELPAVVLVGRPNVGKSTLFNRIAGIRRAIVAPVAGTTRDAIAQPASWRGTRFELTDTGGMFGASADPLHELVVQKGHQALGRAGVVLFVVDAVHGKASADQEIAATLRASGKTVILVVNKIDDRRARAGTLEFFQLGFDPVFEVSAEHGLGIGDLLDEVLTRIARVMPTSDAGRVADRVDPSGDEAAPGEMLQEPEEPPETAVAIVGRPNVGKSSLVNRLLREERVMVSDMPGTTRDAIDVVLTWHRRHYRIVDTAGIRRPGRVATGGAVEVVSVMQSRRAIARAEVVVLVLDAVEGATDQDAAIAGEADRAGRGLIVVANKWDLIKPLGEAAGRKFDDELARQMKFLDYAPVIHVSALTGERLPKLLATIDRVADARRKRVSTGELNRFVEAVAAAHPPVSKGKQHVRILYATQTNVAPPTFVFFTNVA